MALYPAIYFFPPKLHLSKASLPNVQGLSNLDLQFSRKLISVVGRSVVISGALQPLPRGWKTIRKQKSGRKYENFQERRKGRGGSEMPPASPCCPPLVNRSTFYYGFLYGYLKPETGTMNR